MRLVLAILFLLIGAGCSIQKFAINRVGDALSSGGSVYESDEDLELVGDALPFSLKLVESLLLESSEHRGLLLTACKGFASYAYLYVQSDVDAVAEEDLDEARALRTRARKLYLRAHRYGIRNLELSYPRIGPALVADPDRAMAMVDAPKDVPLLYWTAVSLGLAISTSRHDAALLARLPEVDAMLERALALDESWNEGALHEFEIVFAGTRPGARRYGEMEAHFHRATELSRGRRAALFVSYAEAVAVPKQDPAQFRELLDQALAVDPDAHKSVRLANLAAQKRARWLLTRADELILPLDNPVSCKRQ